VTDRFAAAHNLRNFHGKCENLHGHNWLVEVWVQAEDLDDAGLVMDFGRIKKHLADVLETIDHRYLNEIDFFKENNTSSENIARYIHESLAPLIEQETAGRARLSRTAAWESENARALYQP
jgi:6-pyruvoyltetrahydropterin/6-carboxytetrahydropterin synthase